MGLVIFAPPVLVHDVAWKLTDGISKSFPNLVFDRESVLFGAATHDIGKINHPTELREAVSEHETAGRDLLLNMGIPEKAHKLMSEHRTEEANKVVPLKKSAKK